MAKYFKNNKYNPILWQADKAGITKDNLCVHLGISRVTLNKWIADPSIMQLKHITIMSGMFGLSCEEFVYILIRNKAQVKTDTVKSGVFYIDNIRSKHK